jgi:hypothetical protein
MPVFYHFFSVLLAAFPISIVLAIAFAWLIRNSKRDTAFSRGFWFFSVMAFWFLSYLISIAASNFILHKLQASVALPYIQEALDRTCGQNSFIADEQGFYNDSGSRWASSDGFVTCLYNNEEWICSCSR